MLYLLNYFFCSCDLKRLMLTAEAGQMATKVALSSATFRTWECLVAYTITERTFKIINSHRVNMLDMYQQQLLKPLPIISPSLSLPPLALSSLMPFNPCALVPSTSDFITSERSRTTVRKFVSTEIIDRSTGSVLHSGFGRMSLTIDVCMLMYVYCFTKTLFQMHVFMN